jgi:gluconate 2-dehydrogenase gamma chain
MKNAMFNRRAFLKSAVASSAAAVGGALPQSVQAQQKTAVPASPSAGYAYLNPEEAAFIEAVVDHMVPADELSPKGTDLGINT